MTNTYAVTARPDGKWWTFEIPELTAPAPRPGAPRIIAMGQARNAREVSAEARGLAAAWLDIDPETVDVAVRYELPGNIADALTRARKRDADGRAALDEAAALRRSVVHELTTSGISQGDAAIVLGVSRQRVQQLANS